MKKIVILPLAKKNLEDIGNYIAQHNPARAKTFITEITHSFKTLASMPLSGRLQKELGIPNLRAKYFRNYIIFYEPLDNHIDILCVYHGARDISALFDTSEET